MQNPTACHPAARMEGHVLCGVAASCRPRTRDAIEAEAAWVAWCTEQADRHGAGASTFREYTARLEALRAEWLTAEPADPQPQHGYVSEYGPQH